MAIHSIVILLKIKVNKAFKDKCIEKNKEKKEAEYAEKKKNRIENLKVIAEDRAQEAKKRKEEKELERKKLEIAIAKTEKALRKKLNKEYGKKITEKLMNGYYWIGMTDAMALISLGKPSKNNRTVGTWGVKEQWIYRDNNLYLYFEDGILKTYQNSR